MRSSIFQDLEPKRPHLVENPLQFKLFTRVKTNLSPKQEISPNKETSPKREEILFLKGGINIYKTNPKGDGGITHPALSPIPFFLFFLSCFPLVFLFIYFILVALGHVQGFILKENFCEGEIVKMKFFMTNKKTFFAMAG